MSGSPRLPSLSWREVLKALGKVGFEPTRQSGSNIILRSQAGVRVTIPRHDPAGRGLLLEIVAEAGITGEEFLKLL
ncbi:MAG: type II toxin-antitoxin system HicA family toxin [Nitrososphaerota archaeon]|nr:type II toxin-antitoxin system HicA family toxin [Nitrososphaerota archaeon]